jgi:hypothetical protein
MAGVPALIPLAPARIGTAHFCPGGQHVCVLPVLQQDRFFGQQPALPQHRVVRLSQHLRSHSSSFGPQRLHSPVDGFTQRQFFGQHLSLPQRARPCGQRGTQTATAGRIERTHSSLGAQHRSAHLSSPCLQQSPWAGLAQNSPGLQHSGPQGLWHGFGLHTASPGGQMQSYFSKSQQRKLQIVVSGGMRFAGRSWHLQSCSFWRSHVAFAVWQDIESVLEERAAAGLGRSAGTAAEATVTARTRTARDRGIGVTSVRASSSRNSLISAADREESADDGRGVAARVLELLNDDQAGRSEHAMDEGPGG